VKLRAFSLFFLCEAEVVDAVMLWSVSEWS